MQLTVADVIRVSQPTVCRVLPKVCDALLEHIHTFIKMPETVEEREQAAIAFYRFAHFPRTIGAIDCTQIKVQSPGGNLVCMFVCCVMCINKLKKKHLQGERTNDFGSKSESAQCSLSMAGRYSRSNYIPAFANPRSFCGRRFRKVYFGR